MAATFRPVNASFPSEATTENAMPPSAPSFRPSTSAQSQLPTQSSDSSMTPTLATYTTAIAGQRPLPSSPFQQALQAREPAGNAPQRENSQRSAKSPARTSMDVEMDESDGETGTVEENPASDDESVNADGSKSSKKKKSQRFYCTDYPPCNLSFTRSEHLARHIRKHTGERPFQCHCSRRFSRLDNLRQHAQTVHVNEDIPMDSLAATGSRFQRQMRNDRTRQAGNRARASTGGSAGGPPRGHSKSLSTSSISSMASVASAYSAHFDPRRRPPPLIMAGSRLSFESYRSNPESTFSHRPPTPGEYTPTSGTLSTHQSSPQWGLEMVAPSSHSRSQSMYSFSSRPPSRRLSVPSGQTPFYLTQVPTPGRPSFGPMPANSSNYGAIPSPNNGMMASPTMASSDWAARRDSISNAGDDGWRRRTWHPDSHGFNGNPAQLNPAISQPLRPNPPPPIANPTDSNPALRLPGIESFDHGPLRPASPARPRPPPLAVDPQMQARPVQMESIQPTQPIQPDDRRNLNRYDVSLQRGLNRLEIGRKTPPRDMLPRDPLTRDSAGIWASEANKAVQAQAERVQQTVRFEEQPQPGIRYPMLMPAGDGRSFHQHTMSAPNLVPAREMRRHGYHGPTTMQYEDGLPPQQEVRDPRVDRMIHPNLNEFEGFPRRNPSQQMPQQERSNNTDSLRRLEALVAVATSEGTATTAY